MRLIRRKSTGIELMGWAPRIFNFGYGLSTQEATVWAHRLSASPDTFDWDAPLREDAYRRPRSELVRLLQAEFGQSVSDFEYALEAVGYPERQPLGDDSTPDE